MRRALRGRQDRPRRDAGPVRDGAAARARRPRHPDRALHPDPAQDLRDDRALRRAVLDRGSRRRDRADRPDPAGPAADADGQVTPAPAGLLGDPDRRRARLRARAARGGRSRCPSATSRSIASSSSGARTATARRLRDRVSAAEPTCARWSPSSATPTASRCAARGSGRCDVEAADGETLVRARPTSSPRSCRWSRSKGEDARRARHGALVDVEAAGTVVLADADGPICIAEPREGGGVKASVGFRG